MRLMSRDQVGRDGHTAYDLHAGKQYRRQLVDFGERAYFVPVRPGGARHAKLDPKLQDGTFIGIRDRSTRNVRRRPELERWDVEFLTTLKGYALEPESIGGRDGSRCTSRGSGSPETSARTSPSGRGGDGTGGTCSEQVVHQEIRCAVMWQQHKL